MEPMRLMKVERSSASRKRVVYPSLIWPSTSPFMVMAASWVRAGVWLGRPWLCTVQSGFRKRAMVSAWWSPSCRVTSWTHGLTIMLSRIRADWTRSRVQSGKLRLVASCWVEARRFWRRLSTCSALSRRLARKAEPPNSTVVKATRTHRTGTISETRAGLAPAAGSGPSAVVLPVMKVKAWSSGCAPGGWVDGRLWSRHLGCTTLNWMND